MKNIVFVGNKPWSSDKYAKFIDSCDLVVRINHMTNVPYSGTKTDIYMMEYNQDFKIVHKQKTNQSYDEFVHNIMRFDKIYIEPVHYTKRLLNDDVLCKHPNVNLLNRPLANKEIGCTNYSSTVKIICQIINDKNYANYDKYLIFYDLDRYNVDQEIRNQQYHKGAGTYEHNYLQRLLNSNKLKYINVEDNTYINTTEDEILKIQRATT